MHRLILSLVVLLSAGSVWAADEKSKAEPAKEAKEAAKEAPKEAPKEGAKEKAKKMAAGMRTWFQHLKEGLTESSVSAQRQRVGVTAVAAVRGNKQSSEELDKPAWKAGAAGEKSRAARDQREAFSGAVDKILEGELEEGISQLDAFEKRYPESPLLGEAREARQKAREAQASMSASGGQ